MGFPAFLCSAFPTMETSQIVFILLYISARSARIKGEDRAGNDREYLQLSKNHSEKCLLLRFKRYQSDTHYLPP